MSMIIFCFRVEYVLAKVEHHTNICVTKEISKVNESTSRTSNVKRNVFWGYISTIFLALFSLVNRTVFVYFLGAGYLGISGLFTNVLGILSFSELGIGTAINYSLYKPIAENDINKIKSLMQLYKIAYRVIAVVVAGVGLLLFPFLNYLVKSDIPMSQVQVYYLIFLFNTVSSYFVTYKTAFVSALQKDYIVTNTNTIGTIAAYTVQIGLMLLHCNYLAYLIAQAVVGLGQKIVTVLYLNYKYPILRNKEADPIDQTTKNEIWRNVKALIVHKIGDVAVHQTDNIIISVFVNTTTVGLISNYTMLNSFVSKFTNTLFNSFTASFGNLIAKENKDHQRQIFDAYDLMGYWIYGFVFVAFITLSQDFITLWLGSSLLIDNVTMVLFFTALFFEGLTLPLYNFKVAAGRFNEDKWVAFVQAIVNLIVSIAAVKVVGLPGVYIGTIVQRLIVLAVRPYIVYRYVLEKPVFEYYIRFILRVTLIGLIGLLMWTIHTYIMFSVTIPRFVLMVLLTFLLPNLILLSLYGRTTMFKYIVSKINGKNKGK